MAPPKPHTGPKEEEWLGAQILLPSKHALPKSTTAVNGIPGASDAQSNRMAVDEPEPTATRKRKKAGPFVAHVEPCLDELAYLLEKSPFLRTRAMERLCYCWRESQHPVVVRARGQNQEAPINLAPSGKTKDQTNGLTLVHICQLLEMVIGEREVDHASVAAVIREVFGKALSFIQLVPTLSCPLILYIIYHLTFGYGIGLSSSTSTTDDDRWSSTMAKKVLLAASKRLSSQPPLNSSTSQSSKYILQLVNSHAKEPPTDSQWGFHSAENFRLALAIFASVTPTTAPNQIQIDADQPLPSTHTAMIVDERLNDKCFTIRPLQLPKTSSDHSTNSCNSSTTPFSVFEPQLLDTSLFGKHLMGIYKTTASSPSIRGREASPPTSPDPLALENVVSLLEQVRAERLSWLEAFFVFAGFLNAAPQLAPTLAFTLYHIVNGQDNYISSLTKTVTCIVTAISTDQSVIDSIASILPSPAYFPTLSCISLLYSQVCAIVATRSSSVTAKEGAQMLATFDLLYCALATHERSSGPCSPDSGLPYLGWRSFASDVITALLQRHLASDCMTTFISSSLCQPTSPHSLGKPVFSRWYWSSFLLGIILEATDSYVTPELSFSVFLVRRLPRPSASPDDTTIFNQALEQLRHTPLGAIIWGMDFDELQTMLQHLTTISLSKRTELQQTFPEKHLGAPSNIMLVHLFELADLRDRLALKSGGAEGVFYDRTIAKVLDALNASEALDLLRTLDYYRVQLKTTFWVRGKFFSWMLATMQNLRRAKNLLAVIESRFPLESRQFFDEFHALLQNGVLRGEAGTNKTVQVLNTRKSIPPTILSQVEALRASLKAYSRTHTSAIGVRWRNGRIVRFTHAGTQNLTSQQQSDVQNATLAGWPILVRLLLLVEKSLPGAAQVADQPLLTVKEYFRELEALNASSTSGVIDCLGYILTFNTPLEIWRHLLKHQLWKKTAIGPSSETPVASENALELEEQVDENDKDFIYFRYLLSLAVASMCEYVPGHAAVLAENLTPLSVRLQHLLESFCHFSKKNQPLLAWEVPQLESVLLEGTDDSLAVQIVAEITSWVSSHLTSSVPDLYSLWKLVSQVITMSDSRYPLAVILDVATRCKEFFVAGIVESCLGEHLTHVSRIVEHRSTSHLQREERASYGTLQWLKLYQQSPGFDWQALFSVHGLLPHLFLHPTLHTQPLSPVQKLFYNILQTPLAQTIYELPLVRERLLWLLCRQQPEHLRRPTFLQWKPLIQQLETQFQIRQHQEIPRLGFRKGRPGRTTGEQERSKHFFEKLMLHSPFDPSVHEIHITRFYQGILEHQIQSHAQEVQMLRQAGQENLKAPQIPPVSIFQWVEALNPGVLILEPPQQIPSINGAPQLPMLTPDVPDLRNYRNLSFDVFIQWELIATAWNQTFKPESSEYIDYFVPTVIAQLSSFPLERTAQILSLLIKYSCAREDVPAGFQLPSFWNTIWSSAAMMCAKATPQWLLRLLSAFPATMPPLDKVPPPQVTFYQNDRSVDTSLDRKDQIAAAEVVAALATVLRRLVPATGQLLLLSPLPSPADQEYYQLYTSLLVHPILSRHETWMNWMWDQTLEHLCALGAVQSTWRDDFIRNLFGVLSQHDSTRTSFAKHWFNSSAPIIGQRDPGIAQMFGLFFQNYPPTSIVPIHHFVSALSRDSCPHTLVDAPSFALDYSTQTYAELETYMRRYTHGPDKPEPEVVVEPPTAPVPTAAPLQPGRRRGRPPKAEKLAKSLMAQAVASSVVAPTVAAPAPQPLLVPRAGGPPASFVPTARALEHPPTSVPDGHPTAPVIQPTPPMLQPPTPQPIIHYIEDDTLSRSLTDESDSEDADLHELFQPPRKRPPPAPTTMTAPMKMQMAKLGSK